MRQFKIKDLRFKITNLDFMLFQSLTFNLQSSIALRGL